MVAIHSFVHSL